jgi:hypothetical protein
MGVDELVDRVALGRAAIAGFAALAASTTPARTVLW